MKLEQTYLDINEYGEKYHFYHNAENGTIVCTTLYKGQMVRGIAKCDPEDNFDIDFGKKLAYLRCKQKFARKKLKRAKAAEKDAFVEKNRAQHNHCKAYDFLMDAQIQLDSSNNELEQFEEQFNH